MYSIAQLKELEEKDIQCVGLIRAVDTQKKEVPVPHDLQKVLTRYQDVFPKDLPNRLPPERKVDHALELDLGHSPPHRAPYKLGVTKMEELQK